MDEETDFDVIVIGAGFAGAATAFQLLKEGIEGDRILVVDRGDPIGGKNMTGGILQLIVKKRCNKIILYFSQAHCFPDYPRILSWTG